MSSEDGTVCVPVASEIVVTLMGQLHLLLGKMCGSAECLEHVALVLVLALSKVCDLGRHRGDVVW